MGRYWICLLLLSFAAVNAQQGDESYDLYDDDTLLDIAKQEVDNHGEDGPSPGEQKWNKEEWQDYEEYPLYDSPLFDEGADPNDKKDKPSEDKDVKEEFDQIEDNRSEQNADGLDEEKNDDDDDSFEEQSTSIETENSEEIPSEDDGKIDNIAEAEETIQNEDDNVEVAAEEKEVDNDDDSSVYMDEQLDSLDVPVAKAAVNSEEEKEDNIAIEDVKGEEENNDSIDDNDDLNDDNVETVDKYAEEAAKDILESSKGDSIDADSIDQVNEDLNEDLDKLMAIWKKLNDENGDYVEPEKNADDAIDPDEISKYEDKYGVPYGEKYVLSLREQNYDEADNEEKMSDEVDDSKEDDEKGQSQEENVDKVEIKNEDDNETGNENKGDDDGLFKDDPQADDATSEEFDSNENDDANDDDVDVDEAIVDAKDDDTLIEAGDDGILNDESDTANKLAAEKVKTQSTVQSTAAATEKAPTTIDVSNLTAEEYDQLMRQFVKEHADSFDLTKSDVGKYVAPVHITLTQEPLTVTSPNFPSPYPTNNIIDWVFTGEGVGIELIITDFYVNGVMGDYLLVVPGGMDDSSKDGLVFSHMLTEPRRYRFLDVDKMFVRFQSFPGFSFRQGFSFTVRMVSPLPEHVDVPNESLPEPEAQLPAPVETFTVLIGGLTLPEFNESVEQFRLLIADMATMYINANDVDPGLNTTRQVTQITNVAVCNLNWPNSDMCSEVSFSVPLVYEEEQKPRLTEGELRAMWYLYSERDPFALRLRQMGMEEFASPNDSGVLTVWLVIGFGLLISMAMLAFALWRFSCFENYARMPSYSDRDSVYSKQGLDLYPTPHQTLPPLFADNEYKWDDGKFDDSSRVDMGGFSNKSYIRDELLDMDSDEEVITPAKRDRYTTDV